MKTLNPSQKRTWAEINLDNAIHNYKTIKNRLDKNTKLCCVVKANGYGHGAIQMSQLYERLGADYLAVSSIEEALQLRSANIVLPILILGYSDPECAKLLSENNITQCVYSYKYGSALAENAKKNDVKINIHIKLDTGMGRIGFQCNEKELNEVIELCSMKEFVHEGIFTHFASADEGKEGKAYTKKQFDTFIESIDYLAKKGVYFPIRHCANSATIFDYKEMHLDMVRAGIVLYGLQPSSELRDPADLKQVMTFKTIISHIKYINKGDFISYGREFMADHQMRIATIPIGYADGLWRSNYRNNLYVEIEGKMAPVIGRICMDQCMIDISDIPNVKAGALVTVYGLDEYNCIDQIAMANNTINYEIVCAIGERVPRLYIENATPIEVVDKMIVPS